jgi:hypothetical protein
MLSTVLMCVCSGQEFAAPQEKYLKQHVRTERRSQTALGVWGSPSSLEAVQDAFRKFVSDGIVSPWSEVPMSASCVDLRPKLLAMISAGFLPISAIPAVRSHVLA